MGIVSSAGYSGILLLMFIENVFPPIPSEVIMPLAGYMASRGELSLAGIILAGTIGSVLGALPLYYAGRKIGEERLKEFADRHGRWLTLSRADIDGAKRWLDRYGNAAILFCRLIPGVRSLISIPAGIAGMRMAPFIAYTAVGSSMWTALLACLGYFLGSNFGKIDDYLDPITWVIFGIVAVIYIVRVIRRRG